MKKQLIPLSILLVLFLGNLIRTNVFKTIRAVDLIQLLACGALIGILITTAVGQKRT